MAYFILKAFKTQIKVHKTPSPKKTVTLYNVGIRDFKFTVTQDCWLDFNLGITALVMNKCKLRQLDCAHSLLQ
jgi:hypothetical protein